VTLVFHSAYQWRRLVADGLTTDNADVTVLCHVTIVVAVNCQNRRKNCLCKSFLVVFSLR